MNRFAVLLFCWSGCFVETDRLGQPCEDDLACPGELVCSPEFVCDDPDATSLGLDVTSFGTSSSTSGTSTSGTSSTSSSSTSSGSGSTSGAGDCRQPGGGAYGPCSSDADCGGISPMAKCVLSPTPSAGGYCADQCTSSQACTGIYQIDICSASVSCDWHDTAGQTSCGLSCENGIPCPPGMACVEIDQVSVGLIYRCFTEL